MSDEIVGALLQLTQVLRGISASLGIIIIVLICKRTNSNDAIRALTDEVKCIKSTMSRWKD